MNCPQCGQTMNHHADKILLDGFDAADGLHVQLIESYSCPNCGANESRMVGPE